jgi:hypothetical protein
MEGRYVMSEFSLPQYSGADDCFGHGLPERERRDSPELALEAFLLVAFLAALAMFVMFGTPFFWLLYSSIGAAGGVLAG